MKILIVDDDLNIVNVLCEILEYKGYEVFKAFNGFEALKILKMENNIHLIITDIIMPEKEGIETIMEIKQLYPTKKIIAMSGGGRLDPDVYLLLAKRFGAIDVIRKPFDNVKLLEMVNTISNKHQNEQISRYT